MVASLQHLFWLGVRRGGRRRVRQAETNTFSSLRRRRPRLGSRSAALARPQGWLLRGGGRAAMSERARRQRQPAPRETFPLCTLSRVRTCVCIRGGRERRELCVRVRTRPGLSLPPLFFGPCAVAYAPHSQSFGGLFLSLPLSASPSRASCCSPTRVVARGALSSFVRGFQLPSLRP